MKRSRAGYVNATVVVGILAMVASVALTATPATPPAIAEFAPQPQKQNEQVQSELSSESGKGKGGSGTGRGPGPGSGSPTPTPSASPTTPPKVVQAEGKRGACVGDPPRQIEDPQSPPCVTTWSGDNGGATSHGVTANEIRVFWQVEGFGQADFAPLFEKFFNGRFQLYGRNIKLVASNNDGSGVNEPDNEAGQRARADRARNYDKAFAATYYQAGGGYYYHDELSRLGVVNFVSYETSLLEREMSKRAPHTWSYTAGAETMEDSIGAWTCARLAKQLARHAGSPAIAAQQRKFGVLLQTAKPEQEVDAAPLLSALAACGETPAVVKRVTSHDEGITALQQMNGAGVTTIICLCHYVGFHTLTASASGQAFYPEWVVSSFGDLDHVFTFKFPGQVDARQAASIMGLSFTPRIVRLENEPFWHAAREVSPDLRPPADFTTIWSAQNFYRCLLLLASGFQMAGPNLTPRTFEQGLQGKAFPNPAHPTLPGAVGFTVGSHAMTLDAAEFYYDPAAASPYKGDVNGAICYLDRGRRYRRSQWTKVERDPFYPNPPGVGCDSAI